MIKQLDDCSVIRHQTASKINNFLTYANLNHILLSDFLKKEKNLQNFLRIKDKLSIEGNIILRSTRLYIPPQIRSYMTDEFHYGYQGLTALKSPDGQEWIVIWM